MQQQAQSHHIHFTPWAVSRCPNNVNVCYLILIPCTLARALLSPTALQSSWDGGDDLYLVELSPLPGRVTCRVDHFILLRFQKTALFACPLYCMAVSPPCLRQHRWYLNFYILIHEKVLRQAEYMWRSHSLSNRERSEMQARRGIMLLLGNEKLLLDWAPAKELDTWLR